MELWSLSVLLFVVVSILLAIAVVCLCFLRKQSKMIYDTYKRKLLANLCCDTIDTESLELFLSQRGYKKSKKFLFRRKSSDDSLDLKSLFSVSSVIPGGWEDPDQDDPGYDVSNLDSGSYPTDYFL